MNEKKVILVLMDAFRSDYLSEENTPFLYSLARKGSSYKKVSQSRSFCERSEIFTGLSPLESGYFTAIGFDPNDSPFKDMKILNVLYYLEKLIPKNRVFRVYKRFLNSYLKRKGNGMSSYSIPLNILKYFNLTEDKFDFRDESGFDGLNNIFIEISKSGLKTYYDAFTALNFTESTNDEIRLKNVLVNIGKEYNFFPVYQALMDGLGHAYGPDSQEVKQGLQAFDSKMKGFYHEALKQYPDAVFVFVGDHGMTEVSQTIDIGKLLDDFNKVHHLKSGKDYIYFLDSTIFRLWYFNDRVEKLFSEHFTANNELSEKGVFVDKEIAKEQKIPFGDQRYGDLLWMANLGVLVYPDFFHKTKQYKGMHGYDTADSSSKGTCFVSNSVNEKVVIDEIDLTDIYNILKRELGILNA